MHQRRTAREHRYAILTTYAAIFFAVAFSAIAIFTSRDLHDSLHLMAQHPVKVSQAVYNVRRATAEMEIRMGRLARHDTPADVKIVREAIAGLEPGMADDMATIRKLYLGPRDQIAKLKDLIDALRARQEQILNQAATLGSAQTTRLTDAELTPLYRDVDTLLNDRMMVFIGGTGERIAKEALTVLRLSIGGSLLIALLMVGMALLAQNVATKRREEQYFRDYVLKIISENAGNIFLIYNVRQRNVEYVSPNVTPLLGLSPNALRRGMSALLALLEPEQAAEWKRMLYSEVLQTGVECECRLRLPSTGEKKWMLLNLTPVREQNTVTRYILSLSDLTETRKTQQILRDALSNAQNANAAKSNFLSRMSHEIRTPMNAIIGMTAIAASALGDPQRIEDCLRKISYSSRHLLMLINDVLDMSKIESGRLTITAEPFLLPELVHGVTALIQPQAETGGLNFEVVTSDITHEKLIGDALRLNQVLLNLLSNSLKFTPSGGSIRLQLKEVPDGQNARIRLHIAVSDTGVGISEEFQERLFRPFEQERTGRSIQGTGLGMAITKNLVDLMHGSLHVRSVPGRGTTFTVDIAFGVENAGKEKKPDMRLEALRVLVVDDSRDVCEHAALMLDRMGVRGEWAFSGEEAVRRVMAAQKSGDGFHVVFMDWKMPGMDGIEATRRIRRNVGPETLIIVISAYDWREIEQEARQAGADAFIAKPLFQSTIYNTLASVGRARPAQPLAAEEQENVPDFRDRHFLLVEDNELNMEIAVTFLRQTGAETDCAFNGLEAVDRFGASAPGHYDAIVMDVQMPVMDGYEATRAIRRLDRPDAASVPIIAMTANAFAEDVTAALDAGMNAHVGKPIDRTLMLRIIQNELSKGNAA